MNNSLQAISLSGILWAFAPTLIVLAILYGWKLNLNATLHAITRMFVQLLLIGYVLVFIFETEHAGVILSVLGVMLVAASWIALRPVKNKHPRLYQDALLAIVIGGGLTLGLVTQVILEVQPWFLPRYVVPLAGMLFASAMNAVSLAAERFEAECGRDRSYAEARNTALRAALIPVTNSLFAVGLVSLPGMMTGQILSGISPLIAAKYQIVIMCTVFGSSGISAALYLTFAKKHSSLKQIDAPIH
ncbi:ABC transporter permease [Candidatus Nitronereus thalassa]|uniref:ABC transporter permease n=1 Tax=Candidatus Nitronereus thalassa TaxID=3020898 RepID=A0ABU3KCP4_9BACT|nr:ABC transporter permease [Candidatus Nitronereus thalassa]MDT7044279.1 ABC transporter permease [Candidatus Nitronereus thalassa]